MTTIDIYDNDKKFFSMNIESVDIFNRNKEKISNMLESYFFRIKTTQLYEEMKQKIQTILDSDVKYNRKLKLKKISKDYNQSFNNYSDNNFLINITFKVSKEDF